MQRNSVCCIQSIPRYFHPSLCKTLAWFVTNLTALRYIDIGYNKLVSTNPSVLQFLNNLNPTWTDTQTIPPTDLEAISSSFESITLIWTPITYTWDSGYYEIGVSLTPTGNWTVQTTTSDKTVSSSVVDSLAPDTTYYLRLRTYTPTHGNQQNELWSDYTQTVSVTTSTAPAATVTPSEGGTLIYTSTFGTITEVQVPPDAVTDTITLTYLPVSNISSPPSGFVFTGLAFDLTASNDDEVLDGLHLQNRSQ